MVQDRCVSGKPTGWRNRLFLRLAEKKTDGCTIK
jgi:hypothetical protein